jgi:hypothetical protein
VWPSAEPHVRVEATELAEAHGVPALAACDRRFEVSFDDLELVLDDYNTMFEVQTILQELTGGYLHLAWNGELLPPPAET